MTDLDSKFYSEVGQRLLVMRTTAGLTQEKLAEMIGIESNSVHRYPIMAQAYDRYRMTHKFPPTVAEIVEELRHIYYDALETALISKQLGNQEMSNHYKLVMAHTKRYADEHIVSQKTGRKDFFDNLMESVSVSFDLENGYTRKYEE